VIFARGTGEAGNVGTVTGPPFFNALNTAFGAENVAVQGVDYAASTAGFTGDARGNAKMAELVGLAASKCPGTKVVVSGYS
jgi:cutinase